MAAPQITGLVAVMGQFIRENGLDTKTGLSARVLCNSLLMSTATAGKDLFGDYYPVMQQGAGLVNIEKATSAKSYITIDKVLKSAPASAAESIADGCCRCRRQSQGGFRRFAEADAGKKRPGHPEEDTGPRVSALRPRHRRRPFLQPGRPAQRPDPQTPAEAGGKGGPGGPGGAADLPAPEEMRRQIPRRKRAGGFAFTAAVRRLPSVPPLRSSPAGSRRPGGFPPASPLPRDTRIPR